MACCSSLSVLCLGALLVWVLFCLVRWILDRINIGGLHARPVLITGCDTGFGHDLALQCVRNGVHVFAACLTQKGADNLTAEARSLPGPLDAFVMDVTSQTSVDEAVKYVESKVTGLWGLVNNAGIVGSSVPDDWLTVADYERVLSVNTLGVLRGTHAFRHLIKKRQGRIVTVASVCGRLALPTTGPYSVSKHAVEAYCDVIRAELYVFNVHVAMLEPGFFQTNLIDNAKADADHEKVWQRVPDDIKAQYGEAFFREANKARADAVNEWADPGTTKVVDAYWHALFSRFPRARYQVGWDAVFFFMPMAMLWTPLQDLVLSQLMRFRKAPIPKGAVVRPW